MWGFGERLLQDLQVRPLHVERRSLEALYESTKARFREQEHVAKTFSKRCDEREAVVVVLEDQLAKAKAESKQRQQLADAAREQTMQALDTKRTLEQMCSTIQQQQQSKVVSSCFWSNAVPMPSHHKLAA